MIHFAKTFACNTLEFVLLLCVCLDLCDHNRARRPQRDKRFYSFPEISAVVQDLYKILKDPNDLPKHVDPSLLVRRRHGAVPQPARLNFF